MTTSNRWGNFLNVALWAFCSYLIFNFFFKPKAVDFIDSKKIIVGEKLTVPTNPLAREELHDNIKIDSVAALGKRFLVATDLAIYDFAENSAGIVAIQYKKIKDDTDSLIGSLPVLGQSFQKTSSFVLLPDLSDDLPQFYLTKKSELGDNIIVDFRADFKGWMIEKRFILKKMGYGFDVEFEFSPLANENGEVIDSLKNPRLLFVVPIEDIGKMKTLSGLVNGAPIDKPLKIDEKDFSNAAWQAPYLFGAESRFFLHAFLGLESSVDVRRCYFAKNDSKYVWVVLDLSKITEKCNKKFRFYVGPKKLTSLVAERQDLGNIISFGFFAWLYKLVLDLLEKLNDFAQNYGLAIILLALFLRLPFLPVVIWSKKRTAFFEKFEKDHAVEIADINRKYSDFGQRSEQIGKLYSTYGISQFGKIAALAPSILQILFALGLYRVLVNYISLYNAPFVFWIKDLSSKDPYYVLPIVLGLASFIHQRVIAGADAGVQGFAKILKYLSSVFIFIFFATLPAGAVLFWLSNTIFGLLEELVISRFWLRRN